MNTMERVCKVIMESTGVDVSRNVDFGQADFMQIGINSLSFIKTIVAIEEEFGISFDDDELNFDMFGSIDKFCSIIDEKLES